jgi:hypothetical protein
MDAKKRDEFLTVFAGWLLEAGHATDQKHADRLAWDFVVGAWDGDDDLESWLAAYEEAIAETAELHFVTNTTNHDD